MMASPCELAEDVKTAIGARTASASTVTTLQTLLGQSYPAKTGLRIRTPAQTSGPARTTTTNTTRCVPAKKASVKSGKATRTAKASIVPDVHVHEDVPVLLPPKAQYALATDVVNVALKVLSAAAKSKQKQTSSAPLAQGKARTSPTTSHRTLQHRSVNATPTRAAKGKPGDPKRTPSHGIDVVPDADFSYVASTAECARSAFSFLLPSNAKKLGIRELPPLQLENGMLALCGALIRLKLFSLAGRELRALKRVLELDTPQSTARSTTSPASVECTTFSGLLDLKVDGSVSPESSSIVLSYQAAVLQLIAQVSKPGTIEETADYLDLQKPDSIATTILQCAQRSPDHNKASRQMEGLSRTILQLCPSVSATADDVALNPAMHARPAIVFRLQIVALRFQQESRKLDGRAIDREEDLVEPLARCIATLLRRVPSQSTLTGLFGLYQVAFDISGLEVAQKHGSTAAGFNLLRLQSMMAELAAQPQQACSLAAAAVAHCSALEKNHARALAALTRLLSASLVSETMEDDQQLEAIIDGLHGAMIGTYTDWEMLLTETAHLIPVVGRNQPESSCTVAYKRLMAAAATFATRYSHTHTGRQVETVQEIVHKALAICGSNEDLLDWVTPSTAHIMIQSGTLSKIADVAASKSLTCSWTSSGACIALGRALKILVSKALHADEQQCIQMLTDSSHLRSTERGVLLEWQLRYAAEMAHKSRYARNLQKIIPELVKRLVQIYDANDYPLRRARVASKALRIREEHPELLPPHTVAALCKADLEPDVDMALDAGLNAYLSDTMATLQVSRAFWNGRPTFEKLEPSLMLWRSLLSQAVNVQAAYALVEDPHDVASQLSSLEAYFAMLGDDASRSYIADLLLVATRRFSGIEDSMQCAVRQARAYISLGNAEKATKVLESSSAVAESIDHPSLDLLDYYLAKAECVLDLEYIDQCRQLLIASHQIRQSLQPRDVRSAQSLEFKILHSRAWLVHSRFSMASGAREGALLAAKQAAKIMTSVWAGLERRTDTLKTETDEPRCPDDPSVDDVTKKVSKLNLKPATVALSGQGSKLPGALFWRPLRLLCDSLLHLADVYTEFGIYGEANHASQQALKAAETLGSCPLLSSVRARRSFLLATAGQHEDAELCLAQDKCDTSPPCLANLLQHKARAAICLERDELKEAVSQLTEAQATAAQLSVQRYDPIERSLSVAEMDQAEKIEPHITRPKRSTRTPFSAKARSKVPGVVPDGVKPSPTVPKTANSGISKSTEVELHQGSVQSSLVDKYEAAIAIEKALVEVKISGKSSVDTERLLTRFPGLRLSFDYRLLQLQMLRGKVGTALQQDFAFSVLPESILSIPALRLADDCFSPQHGQAVVPASSGQRQKSKASKFDRQQQPLSILMSLAADQLRLSQTMKILPSTSRMHVQCDAMTRMMSIVSATARSYLNPQDSVTQAALWADQARIYASESVSAVANGEREAGNPLDSWSWPEGEALASRSLLSASSFQLEYIDILPKSWTAVSMCLSDACDELYITRYQCSQSPLVLRIPFSRQKSDEAESDVFTFRDGRDELDDIIKLSNFSCHRDLDTSVRGAKTNWWAEREALDRRLQELLINIENLWLGGFKGIFSRHRRDQERLSRFRKAFEAILDRHLPSRQASKRNTKKLVLDDAVLDLFVGLGNEIDAELELDELLAELVFYVIDILQFNGERNAYDEIDVDRMVVDVVDALRTYHDSTGSVETQKHLILVLDRRLQAFPWESLPCLEQASVSRVDSMLSLRERIVAMRQTIRNNAAESPADKYEVSRSSGTYILNPGGDLKGTEDSLLPELSQLTSSADANWTAIVRKNPHEDEIRSALSNSSMLLYFGHGAGSQYIRPRVIRRLEKCSEVVWLMGCSSGAVTEYGRLEPFAVPLTYLLAGRSEHAQGAEEDSLRVSGKCMAIVATLWDVTDKDIDRFSLAVGKEWGLWDAPQASTRLPAKTPRKRERVAFPTTPEKTCKTPKTPKVKKTPAPPRTPARSPSRSRITETRPRSLVEAVAKSRDACYLRYLNGAAPVVYGVPVYLGD